MCTRLHEELWKSAAVGSSRLHAMDPMAFSKTLGEVLLPGCRLMPRGPAHCPSLRGRSGRRCWDPSSCLGPAEPHCVQQQDEPKPFIYYYYYFYRGDGGWLQFIFETEKDLCSACAAVGVKSLARSHFRLCVPINPSNSEAATASLGC